MNWGLLVVLGVLLIVILVGMTITEDVKRQAEKCPECNWTLLGLEWFGGGFDLISFIIGMASGWIILCIFFVIPGPDNIEELAKQYEGVTGEKAKLSDVKE